MFRNAQPLVPAPVTVIVRVETLLVTMAGKSSVEVAVSIFVITVPPPIMSPPADVLFVTIELPEVKAPIWALECVAVVELIAVQLVVIKALDET